MAKRNFDFAVCMWLDCHEDACNMQSKPQISSWFQSYVLGGLLPSHNILHWPVFHFQSLQTHKYHQIWGFWGCLCNVREVIVLCTLLTNKQMVTLICAFGSRFPFFDQKYQKKVSSLPGICIETSSYARKRMKILWAVCENLFGLGRESERKAIRAYLVPWEVVCSQQEHNFEGSNGFLKYPNALKPRALKKSTSSRMNLIQYALLEQFWSLALFII